MEQLAGNIYIEAIEKKYEKIPNAILEDVDNIDAVALTVYCRLRKLGQYWKLNIKGLSTKLKLSDKKIREAICVLEREGYISRHAVRNSDNSRFIGWDYKIMMYPLPIDQRTSAGRRKADNTENRLDELQTTPKTDKSESGDENIYKTTVNNNTTYYTNKKDIDKSISKESEIDLVEQVDTPDNTNVKTPPATDVSEKGVVVVSGAKVREWWQQYCPNLRQPIKWSTKTDNAVRTLLRTTNSTADDLKKAIMLIGSSSLCQGKGKTMSGAKEPWKATLDWLLKNTNDCFCGLFEGKYHFLNNDKDAYNRIIAGEEIEIKDSITDVKPPKGGVQWQG